MGNIGCEFAAVLLGSLLFRYIEGKYYYACRFAIRCYSTYVELIYLALAVGVYFAVAILKRRLYGYAHIVAAIYGKEILSDTGGIRIENIYGGGIYAEYIAAVIQKDKSLVHTVRYLGKLIGALFELAHLSIYLVVLPVYTVKQRG